MTERRQNLRRSASLKLNERKLKPKVPKPGPPYIDALWKNQARSEPLFESNYDPLAYRKR
jgi:hypothetical protein